MADSLNHLKPRSGGLVSPEAPGEAGRDSLRPGAVQRARLFWYKACRRWLYAPISTAQARVAFWLWGASVGKGLRVLGRLRLRVGGRLLIGNGVRIISGPANYVGGDRRMAIWVGEGGTLEIGDGCGLSNSTIVCLDSVTILPETFIGGGCGIYDTDFHQIGADDRLQGRGAVPGAPVRIGPRAFVGGHSIILKGVTIGEGAVVGAGSVVTRDVPDFEIWAGVPARLIRRLEQADSARVPDAKVI